MKPKFKVGDRIKIKNGKRFETGWMQDHGYSDNDIVKLIITHVGGVTDFYKIAMTMKDGIEGIIFARDDYIDPYDNALQRLKKRLVENRT